MYRVTCITLNKRNKNLSTCLKRKAAFRLEQQQSQQFRPRYYRVSFLVALR